MGKKKHGILARLLLNREALELGEALASSGITGAKVVGRGTIVVDGRVIAATPEFQELKKVARQIIEKNTPA